MPLLSPWRWCWTPRPAPVGAVALARLATLLTWTLRAAARP